MNPITRCLLPLAATALLLFVSGCMTPDTFLKGTTSTRTKSANANMQLPTQTGPKPTLAVTGFKNNAGYRGRHDLGKNLEAILESAMVDTKSFRVVDRTALGSVLAEQRLKTSGASKGEGAEAGALASARYIVEGSITEATEKVQGTGGGIKLPIGNTRVGLGGEYTRAQLTAIIKVIDTTTGEVVGKETVRGSSGSTSVNVSGAGRSTSGNIGSFARTPMAEAAQDVANQAAAYISQSVHDHYAATGGGYSAPPPASLPPAPSYGSSARPAAAPIASGAAKVALVSGNEIFINRGSDHGMVVGQTLSAGGGGRSVIDPDTGAVIGTVGGGEGGSRIQIISVEPGMSRAVLVEGALPAIGQEVR